MKLFEDKTVYENGQYIVVREVTTLPAKKPVIDWMIYLADDVSECLGFFNRKKDAIKAVDLITKGELLTGGDLQMRLEAWEFDNEL